MNRMLAKKQIYTWWYGVEDEANEKFGRTAA